VCLNPDTTEYTGLEISGAQVLTADLLGTSFTGLDPNGVYLWSSGHGSCSAPPASWRLGSGVTTAGCCNLGWTAKKEQKTLVTTIPAYAPYVQPTYYFFVEYIHTIDNFLYITNTSTRWRMENYLQVAFAYSINSGLTSGTRIFSHTYTIDCPPPTMYVATYGFVFSTKEIRVVHDDTRTNSGVMSLPYTSSPSVADTRSITAAYQDCGGSVSSTLASNRDTRDITWGFAT